ncbi:hypothetical protein NCS57_01267800 [Fusarium keratoplasticum]|uniref:Uncharacterized protein n=1 Tax=Fusarium keratoplasticum TaxID=1328300 RepID=A0ACC0QLK6_9HYPO|nr:hypothetical protein NCS57_01267800 [Fusarium keratoplasticum]KAI8655196.1 hypothetical protein NCS57_01267800 [Fusarium keratoplasticum]
MASAPLPSITITAPNGEQKAVAVFCLPAGEEELVPAWELFPLEEPTPSPAAAPATAPAPAAAAADPPLLSDSDIDEMSLDELDYKENRCRFCDEDFSSYKTLRVHIGVAGSKRVSCPELKAIIAQAQAKEEEEEDEEDEEDEEIMPARKKRKVAKK